MNNILIEICCGSAEDAIAAYHGGADRAELNSSFFQGGLTPTVGALRLVKKEAPDFPVMCMVRPREGGFCYTEAEFRVMLEDAKVLLENGADGIVFGFLHEDGRVDRERCQKILEVIGEKESVFHRAMDVVPDWREALDTLIELGVTRVLTSGHEPTVPEGIETIRQMVEYAGDRIQILPGCGITAENASWVRDTAGVKMMHTAIHREMKDTSCVGNSSIYFGGSVTAPDGTEVFPPEDVFKLTHPADVRTFVEAANRRWRPAPSTRMLTAEDFGPSDTTTAYWLGSGGALINCRGTLLMFDPVLGYHPDKPGMSEAGFPFLQPSPIQPEDVPRLDAIIYTHADYDHMTPHTARKLVGTGATYHGTPFVRKELIGFGIPEELCEAHKIHETFQVGPVKITLTSALHQWPHPEGWCYAPEDCCGFILDTPDGRIWLPGDSVLLEEHTQVRDIDLMFLDLSDDPYHFGLDKAIMLANQVAPADLILYHYGTYLAPTKKAFCGDPESLIGRIEDEGRIQNLGAGVGYQVHKK